MALPAATIHGAKQLAKWYIKRRAKKKLKKGVVKKTGAVMAYGGAEHREAEGWGSGNVLYGPKPPKMSSRKYREITDKIDKEHDKTRWPTVRRYSRGRRMKKQKASHKKIRSGIHIKDRY